ncbi:Rieske (2Fe-2S) protein [Actinomycetospora termitidis]|uniref:Rieske (2Fe-2S) protein n=1 Tax=Actinomycetospora termitidis TaxID=3053470 RepID=A0ABT7MC21_9PSEU|nr:Rieske (2Fe-2S) protein [Actinomycetospora sp. Odt1-22]MDL5158006.1 Rieske (2Fe-2S) protein [Actinomycetospora sp. Odt1-22]
MSTEPSTEQSTEQSIPTPGLTRRRALCGLVVALAAPAALAACSSGSESGGQAPPAGGSGGGGTTTAPPAGGTPVAQIPVGGGTVVDGPNGPVLLTQPQAGVIKAFDAACPHQGTPVDPPEGGTITCPNHGSQFDATSGALKKGPAESGLTPVATTVVNGQVQFA